MNCSRARYKYSMQELRKARLELHLLEKSGGEGSFGLICCLDRADKTGEEGLTGGRDVGMGSRATIGVRAVMS